MALHGNAIVHCVMSEKSFMLWNQRLVDISIERTNKLVNDGEFCTLDFIDFDFRVNSIKEKQINMTKMCQEEFLLIRDHKY